MVPKGVRITRLPCSSVPDGGIFCCAGLAAAGFALVEVARCCAGTGEAALDWAAGCEEEAGVEGETGVTDVRTAVPDATLTGVPPLDPPPKETTRVDRMLVFPPCVLFEPSCSGMISFRVPLSRTI